MCQACTHGSDHATVRGLVALGNFVPAPFGNLVEVQHAATGGNWTRGYHYATDGNRLLASSLPGDTVGVPATYSATYAHDAHGNMTAMPHLAAIDWDALDRMQHADLGGGGDVYFQYDAAGNRVRKIRVNTAGTQTEERIYLGALELYRERTSGTLQLERETLHVADGTARVCMVETLTVTGGSPVTSPANDARYQYGNHLGTVSLELDEAANTINYEEYHPYGTSAYRAVDSTFGVSAKRYRYTGKERDEETGLDHMGARYYAAWLGRWAAADPIGLRDGVNRYSYVKCSPVGMKDPKGTHAKKTVDSTVGDYLKAGTGATWNQEQLTEDSAILVAVDVAVATAEADQKLYDTETSTNVANIKDAREFLSTKRRDRANAFFSRDHSFKSANDVVRKARQTLRRLRAERTELRNQENLRGHNVEWSTAVYLKEDGSFGVTAALPGGDRRGA